MTVAMEYFQNNSGDGGLELHLVHARLQNMFFDNASIMGVFHERDSDMSRRERLREDSALCIQLAFRSARFRLAEDMYRERVLSEADWIQRLLNLPSYAGRIVAEFAVAGSLPKGLPVVLYRWQGSYVLSFAEDLSLKRRREYAARCALSTQPVLNKSGRASIKAFASCLSEPCHDTRKKGGRYDNNTKKIYHRELPLFAF